MTYTAAVPKLWNETIETHRREVRDAILTTTAALVVDHGLLSVTMSQIAEETGIGRATLYKYFPDIDAILAAWHERQITDHLHRLADVRDQAADPAERLRAVLTAYAHIAHGSRGHLDADVVRLLHRGDHVAHAEAQVRDLISGLITEAAAAGLLRQDVPPPELAGYCLHALSASGALTSQAAMQRLVQVTMTGLRPDHES